MAMTYKNYPDFVKKQLHAVPLGVAQPQMRLTAVLQKKLFRSPEFVRLGHLACLCANTEYQEQIKGDLALANMETFQPPFVKQVELQAYEGIWNSKQSGMLGFAVPDTASLGAWLMSHSKCRYTIHGITTHHLKDEYVLDIIRSGKWKPNTKALKDFYFINEVILATNITVRVSGAISGGVGTNLNPLAGIPIPANAGVDCSVAANGILEISGVMENGVVKPFPIAFRCVHVVYNSDFTKVKNLELSVRRGEHDGLHVSQFVRKDEKYHIGGFFLNTVEDDEESGDEESDDDVPGPEIIPVSSDEISEIVAE